MIYMDDWLESLLSGQQYKKFQETFFGPIGEQYGLSILDIRVLLFLHEHKRHDTAKDIVELHHWTKSYVSKSIESLIEGGYLGRKPDASDRRRIHLVLQENARPVIEQVKQEQIRMLEILFCGISQEEVRVVSQVARKISRNIAGILH